jgi:hypothetical protein
VSDAGGSRRSYKNGRASAVAEGTPFSKGPPKSSVVGTPGWNLLSSARRYGWPPPSLYLSVRRDLRSGLGGVAGAPVALTPGTVSKRPAHRSASLVVGFSFQLNGCREVPRSSGGVTRKESCTAC